MATKKKARGGMDSRLQSAGMTYQKHARMTPYVKRLMYDAGLEPLVEACGPVLVELFGQRPSGIRALMEAAPDDGLRKLMLSYEAEMNARTAAALRVGMVVGMRYRATAKHMPI